MRMSTWRCAIHFAHRAGDSSIVKTHVERKRVIDGAQCSEIGQNRVEDPFDATGLPVHSPRRRLACGLLLNDDPVVNASDALGILRNHLRQIACILGRRLPAQPYGARIVGVHLNVGQS